MLFCSCWLRMMCVGLGMWSNALFIQAQEAFNYDEAKAQPYKWG
jgi:hypothetical protein